MKLRPVPSFRVTGQLDGASDAVSRMSLRLMSAGTEALGRGIEQATALVGADSSFTFLNVPAGSYVRSRTVSRPNTLLSNGAVFQIVAPGAGRGSMTTTSVFSGRPARCDALSASGQPEVPGPRRSSSRIRTYGGDRTAPGSARA